MFSWRKDVKRRTIRLETLPIRAQSCSCIVRPVYSGKSTFLQVIVGHVWKAEGTVEVRGSITYVAQTPWFSSGSAKENFLRPCLGPGDLP
jgi:ATP-binding cassette subfamily C (CFTR/MRP) protein 1